MKKTQTIRVLVASRNKAIPAALGGVRIDKLEVESVEAITVGGAYRNLTGCALAIVDREDLIPSPDVSSTLLAQMLAQAGIPVVSGAEFAATPSVWLERTAASSGALDALPPKRVMITAYSGGVGKTTLALNLARYAAGTLRLPVAVIEVAFGASAFRALTDPTLPDLYDVLTQGKAIGQWQGVTLLPMDYASARLLLNRAGEVQDLIAAVANRHALTLIDAHAANPFRALLEPAVDVTLAIAGPRPDALANAARVVEENGNSIVVLNRVDGLGDQLSLAGVKAGGRLPLVGRPDDDPRLAEALLQIIYPGWKPGKK
ncbi:MAG: hypothetical protein JW934_03895 [Anaerolineae bacterium]|nr:hypothetical protein [Anaerolineae bacterium]